MPNVIRFLEAVGSKPLTAAEYAAAVVNRTRKLRRGFVSVTKSPVRECALWAAAAVVSAGVTADAASAGKREADILRFLRSDRDLLRFRPE